jgi:peptidoglycan/LPS O-acetylase OafA/YrhL
MNDIKANDLRHRSSEIKALTGLRGLGAVWVFLYHLFYPNNTSIDKYGWLAVPMFFVLSGFVLHLVHEYDFHNFPQPSTLRSFFALRFARVYPLHLFSLLFLLGITIILPGFIERYQGQRFSAPNFFANLFLVQTWGIGHFAGFKDASDSWNSPSWSLSAEFVYYLFFPWIAYITFQINKRRSGFLQIISFAALTLLIYSTVLAHENTYTRNLLCGLFAFCLGVSMHSYYNIKHHIVLNVIILEIISVSMISGAFLFDRVNIGLFVVGIGILIYSLAHADSNIGKLFAAKPIHWFGTISYSIYLIHWPIIQIFNWYPLKYKDLGKAKQLPQYFIITFVVIFLSYLTYQFVEVPARKRIRELLFAKKL